jgi:hypothetical protein
MTPVLSSRWPYVGLLLTWMCVLLAHRLIPGQAQTPALLFWSVLPCLYGTTLVIGYLCRNKRHWSLDVVRGIILAVGALGAMLPHLLSRDELGASLFYAVAMVQVSLGVTLSRERGLYAGLAISCVMFGFAASRPRSDTPLLLMLLPFIACFIFTLVSHQSRVAVERLGPAAPKSPRRGHVLAGLSVVLATVVLGIGLVAITPSGSMGPMQWQLDRDFLLDLSGQPGAGGGPAGTAETSGTPDAYQSQGPGKSTFLTVLQAQLMGVKTLGDLVAALGTAAHAQAKVLAQALGLALPDLWGLLLWLLPLLLLARPVRQRLRVQADRLRYRLTPLRPLSRNQARQVAAALARLLALRGYPRPAHRTWSAHLRALPARQLATRRALRQFAGHYESGLYGKQEDAPVSPELVRLYLALFALPRRRR